MSMTRYEFIGILALLILIVVLPVYGLLEPYRLQEAQFKQMRRYVVDGTGVYLDNCVECHGPAGQGVGVMPALNKLGASDANHDLLFERCRKEIRHELGHTFGLTHCVDKSCAMSLSITTEHIDRKDADLCRNCHIRVMDKLDTLRRESGAAED